MNRRSVTLYGAIALFAAVSATLFLSPAWASVVFGAYTLIFLWLDLRKEGEYHVIFLFLVTVACALAATRVPDGAERVGLALECAAICFVSFGLGLHRNGRALAARMALARLEEHDTQIRDSERELHFYEAYETSTVAQVSLRRDLTQAAKSLGAASDPSEVQLRLMQVMQARYKDSRVELLPGQPDDPLVHWAVQTKTPVLVKDMRKEDRFGRPAASSPYRSAMLVPMSVMKKPFGFLRVESAQPQAYTNDDLRTLDLFATMASLSLENMQLYSEVHNLAVHDSLTQLFTQRMFLQRLKDELLRAGRSQSPLALIMGDVDHFKSYNDTYGHQAGDELLRAVSRILGNFTRAVDCVARYGGEEFAVILPNMVRERAVDIAERIRLAVAAEPFLFRGQRTRVTMSFGVAAFPQDATSQSQLIRVADERLYQSKDGGRNRTT